MSAYPCITFHHETHTSSLENEDGSIVLRSVPELEVPCPRCGAECALDLVYPHHGICEGCYYEDGAAELDPGTPF